MQADPADPVADGVADAVADAVGDDVPAVVRDQVAEIAGDAPLRLSVATDITLDGAFDTAVAASHGREPDCGQPQRRIRSDGP